MLLFSPFLGMGDPKRAKDPVSHCGHSLWTISVKGPCVTLWEAFVSDLGLRTLCYIMGSICERFWSNNPVLHLRYGMFLWNSICVKGPCGSVVHCLLFVSVPGLSPSGSPNAWWDGSVHNRFPTHVPTAVHVSAMLPAFLAATLQSVDFSNGACHVMKTTTAECSPDMELFTHQTFCFSPNITCQQWQCQKPPVRALMTAWIDILLPWPSSFLSQFLDMQEDEELRTHLNIFHEHKDEDLEEFSHRYDNIRMELEYPCLFVFAYHFDFFFFFFKSQSWCRP